MGRSTLAEYGADRHVPMWSILLGHEIDEMRAVEQFVAERDHRAANKRMAEWRFDQFFRRHFVKNWDLQEDEQRRWESWKLCQSIRNIVTEFWADAD